METASPYKFASFTEEKESTGRARVAEIGPNLEGQRERGHWLEQRQDSKGITIPREDALVIYVAIYNKPTQKITMDDESVANILSQKAFNIMKGDFFVLHL
ncbi:unnamed protein product [Dovyalis caffra]|uniref:Uncharacterized protein n=1 Tax=Dovyalis caffra TaxID=77055 RepID=A0AAV1RZF4_9ROSI|nr:unnamed protein product [Dovyalis caffra]